MHFPLLIALLVYAIPLLIALAMLLTNIYHVVRFGSFDARNKVVAWLFLIYTFFILGAAGIYFAPVDWSQAVTIPLPELPFLSGS